MMQGLGDAIGAMFTIMAVLIVVFVPLGLWKAIELIMLLFKHIAWV